MIDFGNKMLISTIEDHRDVLQTILVNELRNVYHIKYHKDTTNAKTRTKQNAKTTKSRVFNVPLQNLQLTDAILVNGGVVQVPHFISDSCQKILDHADTEGIFRKAGSAQRLKEIRIALENGKSISRSVINVIDLGDVLKSFFRDLPEPLLAPGSCQEMMLRCLLLPRESERVNALLLTCLLLPPVTLSTLSFFMQFLNKIASQCSVNRMTVQNLAIVFTPSLMPLTEQFNSVRLSNHVKVIELLIEHSTEIGIVPKGIVDQLSAATAMPSQEASSSAAVAAKAKSKKRRSSSVTRFCVNGLKKIVNNVRRESVDNNLDGGGATSSAVTAIDSNYISQTPLLTGSKKRKHIEIASVADQMGFSAKKKRDILPELLSTPMIFKEKKRRPSLISHFRHKNVAASQQTLQDTSSAQVSIADDSSPPPPPLPRRWSDATGTPRAKMIVAEQQQQKFMSPVASLPCLTLKASLDHLEGLRIPSMDSSSSPDNVNDDDDEEDYVRIPKREYEAIKSRMTEIERRISREFDIVQTTKQSELSGGNVTNVSGGAEGGGGSLSTEGSGMETTLTAADGTTIANVQDEYERALEETEELNRSQGGTDELAKRLGRNLKIRRSGEQKIMRSPSARKIGSIRRRSRDLNRGVSRTKSLNIPTESEEESSFYPRQTSNLRRGRPNTVQTGLKVHRSPQAERRMPRRSLDSQQRATLAAPLAVPEKSDKRFAVFPSLSSEPTDEIWTDAKDFFAPKPQVHHKQPPMMITPNRTEANERRASLRSAGRTTPGAGGTPTIVISNPVEENANLLKTPMLPPKRTAPRKTPGSSMAKNHYLTPLQQAQQTGRASIARIRSQNAGMVLAKARLFNDLVGDEASGSNSVAGGGGIPMSTRNSLDRIVGGVKLDVRRAVLPQGQKENRISSPPLMEKTFISSFRKPHIKPVLLANSPRRIVKTPTRERATPVRALPRSPRQTTAMLMGNSRNATSRGHF